MMQKIQSTYPLASNVNNSAIPKASNVQPTASFSATQAPEIIKSNHSNHSNQNNQNKSQVALTNHSVASITNFSPRPGKQSRRTLDFEVRNTPSSRVDQISDAIQRYLDIRPRREPTADPLDEASVARHPQQILQASDRWNQAMKYQFSSNGNSQSQFLPKHHDFGGQLELNIENPGITGVSSSAVQEPNLQPRLAGVPNIVDNPGFNPESAGKTAIGNIQEALNAPKMQMGPLPGPPNIVDNPSFNPEYAGKIVMGNIQEALNAPKMQMGPFPGPPNMLDNDELNQPLPAGLAAFQAGASLASIMASSGKMGRTHQSRNTDNDYLQAMRLINGFNRPTNELVLNARA